MFSTLPFQYILLADDDEDELLLLGDILKSIGIPHNIFHVLNYEELDRFLHAELIPTIIFLDINMPGRHGIVCLKEIRQLSVYDNVPVIMYSHARNPEEIEACRQAGASLYVSKPSGYLSMEKIFRQIFSMNWPERPWIMDKENFVLNNP